MNFIVNKITYILERPWLIVFSLVVILGIQISNLKKEVQDLKNDSFPAFAAAQISIINKEVQDLKSQIDPTYNIKEVFSPLPSNQISIPQSQSQE